MMPRPGDHLTIHVCDNCGRIEGGKPQAGCCPGCGVASEPRPYLVSVLGYSNEYPATLEQLVEVVVREYERRYVEAIKVLRERYHTVCGGNLGLKEAYDLVVACRHRLGFTWG